MLEAQYNTPSKNFIESIKQSLQDEIPEDSTSIDKGHLFLKWVLTKTFQATDDDAENGILDGPNDHGIDAILEVHGSEMNFFRIFQSKYRNSHSVDEIRSFKAKMDELLEKSPNDLPRGRIRDTLIRIKEKGWDVEIVYVTDQKVDFGNQENFQVFGFDRIVEKMWNDISEPAEGKIEVLTLEDYIKYNETIIGVISLKQLGELVLKSKKYIFESNIRKFLQVNTKVNKQLRKSLLKEPEEVFYYNNGVTIVVKNFKELGNGKIELVAPQIVNGAQTSTTIADVVKGDRNIKGNIQVTIIAEDIRTTRNNITKYRNSQNAVKGKDLISLERFHDSIYGQMKAKLGYYYEQQAGSWVALSKAEKDSYKGNETFNKYLKEDTDFRIPANDAIQAMAAALTRDPAKPYGSISKYMPGGKGYDKIFTEEALPDDYRLLLYPYLVKSYCEKKYNYGSKKCNMDEKKYARLLFVTTYFIALQDHVLEKKIDLRTDSKVLDPYFEDFENNEKLLELTDKILDQFFDHTLSIRQDEDGRDKMTLHNFFASHVWLPKARLIMKGVMGRKRESFKEIQELFKKN